MKKTQSTAATPAQIDAQLLASAIAQAVAQALGQALAQPAPVPATAPEPKPEVKPVAEPKPEVKPKAKAQPRRRAKAQPEPIDQAQILRVAAVLSASDPWHRGLYRLAEIVERRVRSLGPDLAPAYLARIAGLSGRDAVKFAQLGSKELRAQLEGK
jgi:hypothetical protein